MVRRIQLATIFVALCTHGAMTQAQKQVYRCGGSYSNQPCAGATVIPTDDARSPAQRAQSDALTQRDARSAQAMERERLKQEGKPAPAVIPPPKADEPAAAAHAPASVRKPEVFKAVAGSKPGDPPPKKKKRAKKKPD